MTYADFLAYANGVKAGRNQTPANAPKDIVLFEVQDQTASAKLTAWWARITCCWPNMIGGG